MQDIDSKISNFLNGLLEEECENNNLERVKYLIENKDVKPKIYGTESIEILEYLINCGADIEEEFDFCVYESDSDDEDDQPDFEDAESDEDGHHHHHHRCHRKAYISIHPLTFACMQRNKEMVELILSVGANINADPKLIRTGFDIQYLIDSGFNLNVKPYSFLTYKHCIPVIKYLAENGLSNINWHDKKWNSILMILASRHGCDIGILLKNTDLQLNKVNKRGESALIIACKEDNYEAAKCLVFNGIGLDKTIKDKEGKTALNYIENEEKRCLKIGEKNYCLGRFKEMLELKEILMRE